MHGYFPITFLDPGTSLCYILITILYLLSGVSYSSCKFFIHCMKLTLHLSGYGNDKPSILP